MKIQIHLGALAEPLSKQFPQLSRRQAKLLQADADAISRLRIGSLIGWREGERAYERLTRRIAAALSKVE